MDTHRTLGHDASLWVVVVIDTPDDT